MHAYTPTWKSVAENQYKPFPVYDHTCLKTCPGSTGFDASAVPISVGEVRASSRDWVVSNVPKPCPLGRNCERVTSAKYTLSLSASQGKETADAVLSSVANPESVQVRLKFCILQVRVVVIADVAMPAYIEGRSQRCSLSNIVVG